MDVVGAVSCGVEGIGAQDLSVGGDHEDVASGQFGADLGDAGRLLQGEVAPAGEFGDGRWGRLASAAPAAVGLRDTSPTSWGEEIRAPRMVAAKSGVPANATFKGVGSALLG